MHRLCPVRRYRTDRTHLVGLVEVLLVGGGGRATGGGHGKGRGPRDEGGGGKGGGAGGEEGDSGEVLHLGGGFTTGFVQHVRANARSL